MFSLVAILANGAAAQAPQVRPLDVKSAAAKKSEVDKEWAAATGSK